MVKNAKFLKGFMLFLLLFVFTTPTVFAQTINGQIDEKQISIPDEEVYYHFYKSDGKFVKEKVSKETALKQVKMYKEKENSKIALRNITASIDNMPFRRLIALDYKAEESWIRMIITHTTYAYHQYKVKNEFEWLTRPVFTLSDVIGVTSNPSLVYLENTIDFKYYRDIYSQSGTTGQLTYLKTISQSYTEKKFSDSGVAVSFDLISDDGTGGMGIIAENHRGYFSAIFTTADNSFTGTSAVQGKYIHKEGGFNGVSFSVVGADISLSGGITSDEVDNFRNIYVY